MNNLLKDKKIVIGISGGIAAYKIAELVRQLIKSEAQVKIMMTPAATQFISPTTFAALSGNTVYTEIFDDRAPNAMPHIELAKWADLIVIAPATANVIAEVAHGFANNIISTTCLATTSKIIIAPAMNKEMWANPATKTNTAMLVKQNKIICGPAVGNQACGDYGYGCMVEPEVLLQEINRHLVSPILRNKNILVTAGPTQEAIDPVRFLSNRSSGKMGYAIAEMAHMMGANVTLISGPTTLKAPHNVKRINVTSAQEMLNAVMAEIATQDIFIATAAVADYCAATISQQKIKKTGETLSLTLKKNPDILKTVSLQKQKPYLVGFAAETSSQELLNYAHKKLKDKNLDMIVANFVSEQHAFDKDTNEVIIICQEREIHLPLQPKLAIASQLLSIIADNIYKT